MNIKTCEAGSVKQDHILSRGFRIFEVFEGSDMGQGSFECPQFTNGEYTITGGYWSYDIKDLKGNLLFHGWWNSNDEFDQTLNELGIKYISKHTSTNFIDLDFGDGSEFKQSEDREKILKDLHEKNA